MFKIFLSFLISSFFFICLSADESYPQAIKIKKIYPLGEKIYNKKCQSIDIDSYPNYQSLKMALSSNNLCQNLNEKHLEAVLLYLWEVKKVTSKGHVEIEVTKDEKCPVCGMFIYKYPRWASQIFYNDKHYSFDGMKDLMKYYFDNNSDIVNILTRDYYSQKAFDAREGFYVLGSDVYGPMGNELIPFENEKDAKKFYIDHKGTKVLKFDEISSKIVFKLDE